MARTMLWFRIKNRPGTCTVILTMAARPRPESARTFSLLPRVVGRRRTGMGPIMRTTLGCLALVALAGCAGPSTRLGDTATQGDCERSGGVWRADRSHCERPGGGGY